MAQEMNKGLGALVLLALWVFAVAVTFDLLPEVMSFGVTWSALFSGGSFINLFWIFIAKMIFLCLVVGVPYFIYKMMTDY